MTNEPKVRAEVVNSCDVMGGDTWHVYVKHMDILDDTFLVCFNKELAELIASKINAPDPIAIIEEMREETKKGKPEVYGKPEWDLRTLSEVVRRTNGN